MDQEEQHAFEDRFLQTYRRGDIVFAQGSTGTYMYVIVSGAVEIRREKDGAERTVAELGPGEIFGELAVVDSEQRMATAVAAADETRLVAIDQARFVYLSSQQPAFALTVMRVMAERIRALGKIIDGN